jgi:hypothetical protein
MSNKVLTLAPVLIFTILPYTLSLLGYFEGLPEPALIPARSLFFFGGAFTVLDMLISGNHRATVSLTNVILFGLAITAGFTGLSVFRFEHFDDRSMAYLASMILLPIVLIAVVWRSPFYVRGV